MNVAALKMREEVTLTLSNKKHKISNLPQPRLINPLKFKYKHDNNILGNTRYYINTNFKDDGAELTSESTP